MKKILIITTILTFNLFSPVSYSQTSDGLTPAVETVCDEVKGATPGLYGLCVAYCEAMDGSESIYGDTDTLLVPNRKILEKYDAKRQPWDPQMPCVSYDDNCPLWDADFIAGLDVNLPDRDVTWIVDDNQITYGSSSVPSGWTVSDIAFFGGARKINWAYVVDNGNGTYYGSGYRVARDADGGYYPNDPDNGIDYFWNSIQQLTEEEYTACKTMIEANEMEIDCPTGKTLNTATNLCE